MALTLCLFGSYDPGAPRLGRLKAGWLAEGGQLRECHAPLWPEAGERAKLPAAGASGWVGPWLKAQLQLFRQRRVLEEADAILVPYPGHLDMPLARLLASWYRKPLVFDPFLSFFDTAILDRRLFPENAWQARVSRFVDRLALRFADKVLADTGPMADFYAELGEIPRERVRVVPVGADEKLFDPQADHPHPSPPPSGGGSYHDSAVDASPPPDGGGGGDVVEVLFYGRMIPLHGVETIVHAAKLLENEPGIRFHLVGMGQVSVERLVEEFHPGNLRWTRSVDYAKLPGVIADADICLGIFGRSGKAARVVPHKVYEAAAMGKAIVTADTPAVREAFAESLVMVPAGDARALAQAIHALAVAPVRRQELGAAARARFEEAFDTRAIGRDLVRALG